MAATRVPIPRAFFLVSAANFLSFLNLAFFFLLPLWVVQQGGGEEVVGRVGGIQGFAGLLALPLIAVLLDRFGRRRFLICGIGLGALCSVAFLFLDGIGTPLYVVRILQGIAFTSAFTGAQTLAVLFAPIERRAEAIGWFGISTILTHAISPVLGEEIIRRWGYEAMFATGATVGVAAFVLSCFIPKPPEFVAKARSEAIDPRLARMAVGTATLAMLCYGFGFGATQTFVPVLMERFDIGRVGAFFAAWSLAAVAVRVLFGSVSDRLGRRTVLVPAMIALSTAVAMLAFVRSMPAIVAIGAVFGMGHGMLYPTMNAWVADWSTPRNIGRTQSLFSGSYSLGVSSCAFFFGTLVETRGYSTMFLVASSITVVGLLVFLAGPREVPDSPGGEPAIGPMGEL
jgi:MFS family permease